ncbi:MULTISPECIES: acetyltransferase [Niastella]|uniref:Acetyltransferase n=1 Tax=Niastella soli TaxID=2821487 RepID=A0ABS3YSG0_9BACT|nr:acetyltransferase [Niastella soli]MBO9200141.1 acetyltransferase [Niastella soli]
MANKVIIFGIQDYAELAHYYLTNDSSFEVAAFCVNEKYIPESKSFRGLPVVPFEDVEHKFPICDYSFFAPMAPKKMNQVREAIYGEVKEKGYNLISYISSKVTMFNNEIGDNCFILENNTLQPFTKIGNNVVLWSGNHIGHHGEIRDHVTFTSHVVMSGHCIIGENSFLGVNATLRDGITLAKGTLVGMASAITKSTEEWGVYIGNPAKKLENKLSTSLL